MFLIELDMHDHDNATAEVDEGHHLICTAFKRQSGLSIPESMHYLENDYGLEMES